MNTSFREVLREVLSGILITEPNRGGVGLVEVDAPERRGFRDGTDLRLGAINTTNVNEKRGRRGDNQKNSNTVQ